MHYQSIYDQLIAKRKANPIQKPDYYERHHIIPKALGGSDEKHNIALLTAREHFIAHLLLAKIHGGSMWIAAHYMMHPKSKAGKNCKIGSRTYQTIKENHSKIKSIQLSGESNHWYGKQIPWEFTQKMRGPRPSISGSNNPSYGKCRKDVGVIISHVKTYDPRAVKVDLSLRNYIDKKLGISITSAGKYRLGKELKALRMYMMFKQIGKRDKSADKNPNYGNGQAISGSKNPMFGKEHSESTKQKISEKSKRRIVCPHCGKDGNIANMHRWHFDNCSLKVAA